MNTKRIVVLVAAGVMAIVAALLARGMMGGGTPKVEAKIAPADADERCTRRRFRSAARPGADGGSSALAEMAGLVGRLHFHHAQFRRQYRRCRERHCRAQPADRRASPSPMHRSCMAMQSASWRRCSIRACAPSPSPSARTPAPAASSCPTTAIDLILIRKGDANRVNSSTLLSDVRVLAVDQTFKQEKDTKTVIGKTATLEVTPAQAEQVAKAQSQGTLVSFLASLGQQRHARGQQYTGKQGIARFRERAMRKAAIRFPSSVTASPAKLPPPCREAQSPNEDFHEGFRTFLCDRLADRGR